MTVLGESTLTLANDKHSVQCTALIVADCSQSVLVSWHDLQKLGIIPGTFPACANSARIKCLKDIVICEFPEVFTDKLPDRPMNVETMHIHLKDKAVPTRISTARQVPLCFQAAADSTLRDLLTSGVVVRENDPTDWCSPAFFVPKACGKKVRLVTD